MVFRPLPQAWQPAVETATQQQAPKQSGSAHIVTLPGPVVRQADDTFKPGVCTFEGLPRAAIQPTDRSVRSAAPATRCPTRPPRPVRAATTSAASPMATCTPASQCARTKINAARMEAGSSATASTSNIPAVTKIRWPMTSMPCSRWAEDAPTPETARWPHSSPATGRQTAPQDSCQPQRRNPAQRECDGQRGGTNVRLIASNSSQDATVRMTSGVSSSPSTTCRPCTG